MFINIMDINDFAEICGVIEFLHNYRVSCADYRRLCDKLRKKDCVKIIKELYKKGISVGEFIEIYEMKHEDDEDKED